MQKLRTFLLMSSFLVTVQWSCSKDENKIYLEGGTSPVLTASSTSALTLLKDNKDNTAITFNWTNPDYRFTTGPSSQDVTYILQVDTAGANFLGSTVQETSIARDLAITLTVKELNEILTKMELAASVVHNMEMRIKASLVNGSAPLYSNVLKIAVTPYLDFVVEPPGTAANNYTDGNLWALGDAFASGWDNPIKTPFDTTQKFTKTDVLHYVINSVTFNATGGYKLIQQQGNWDTQYHAVDGTAKLEGSLEKKNSDPTFPSPGAGKYKIEVNFQTGKYKLTKL